MQNRLHWMPSIFAPFYALLSRWVLSLILVFGAAFTFLELAEDVWLFAALLVYDRYQHRLSA
jgi:hypothetical protein